MSLNEQYFSSLKTTLAGVVEHLRNKGIDGRHLAFGGEGQPPARKPTVPTDARSEFLANRAMGDWAERMFSAASAARCLGGRSCSTGALTASRRGIPNSRFALLLASRILDASESGPICCFFRPPLPSKQTYPSAPMRTLCLR